MHKCLLSSHLFFYSHKHKFKAFKESAFNFCINKARVILGCVQCPWTPARQPQFSGLLFKPQINGMQFATQMYFLGTAALTDEHWHGQGRKGHTAKENVSVQVLGNEPHTHSAAGKPRMFTFSFVQKTQGQPEIYLCQQGCGSGHILMGWGGEFDTALEPVVGGGCHWDRVSL